MVDAVLPTILDGGLATELERRGHDLSDDLWSARLLRDDPDEIIATHLSFFRAGADVATTASYQASFDGFARHGLSTSQAEQLMRSSVELARVAASLAEAEDGVRRVVAASVGPYGAVRADGSEYSGDYGVSDAHLGDFHRSRMAVLADAGADLLALETVPSQQEATVLLELLEEMPAGTSAWLSLTCADARRTRRGEDVAAVFELAASSGRLVAVGVNCTAPQHVAALVRTAVEASGKPAIAYPNSGEGWDAEARSWSGPGTVVDPAMAREWVTAGATYVGGCCRVGSADIAGLATALG
ncbi:MAG: homocysteine S-methyltransferase [Actinomycetota bacterium]|nr:homocysteine S-methyltransferase [Actinomycetota bacterium]MDQ1667033.1 homocysteine S-methyltransferase [Actinomycetota bacterium]